MALGKGRREAATEYCHVVRDVLCPKGHKVGAAWKYIPPDPRNGYRVSGMTWEETPGGGKVEGRCPKCGADVQVRWQRITEALDRGESEGRHSGTFDPGATQANR